MTTLQDFLLNSIEILCLTLLCGKLINFSVNFFKFKSLLYYCITLFLTNAISYYVKDQSLLFFLTTLIIISYFSLYFSQSFANSIFCYILSALIISIIEVVCVLGFSPIFNINTHFFVLGIITILIVLFSTLLICYFIPLNSIFKIITSKFKFYKFFVLNLYFIHIFCLILWKTSPTEILNMKVVLILLALLSIITNYIVLKTYFDSEYLTKEIEIYKKYNPMIDELIKELRTRQHEFNNHIQSMNMFLMANKLDSSSELGLKKYINDMNIANNILEHIKLENKLISGLLFYKKKVAEEKGVNLELQIKINSITSNLKEYEIVEILGILIDNAIETNIDNNHILVNLSYEDSSNVISVKNKHPYIKQNEIKNMLSRGYSTKSKSEFSRGFGLYNVKKIIDRNKARLEILNEKLQINNIDENYFVIRILYN